MGMPEDEQVNPPRLSRSQFLGIRIQSHPSRPSANVCSSAKLSPFPLHVLHPISYCLPFRSAQHTLPSPFLSRHVTIRAPTAFLWLDSEPYKGRSGLMFIFVFLLPGSLLTQVSSLHFRTHLMKPDIKNSGLGDRPSLSQSEL